MATMSEEHHHQWKLWTLEVVLSDLSSPQPLIELLLSSLPSSPPLPPPLLRRLLLRQLRSLASLHLPPPLCLHSLKILDLLLPPSAAGAPPASAAPPESLCRAYAAVLFYLRALCPLVPAAKVEYAVNRLRNYEFAPRILGLFERMVEEQEGGSADVISVRQKAGIAVQEFVKEQLEIMEPPFFIRAAKAYIRAEQNGNGNEGPSTWHANDSRAEEGNNQENGVNEMVELRTEETDGGLNANNPTDTLNVNDRTEAAAQEANGVLTANDPISTSNVNDGTDKVGNEETHEGLNVNDPTGTSNENERTEMENHQTNGGLSINDPPTSQANDMNQVGNQANDNSHATSHENIHTNNVARRTRAKRSLMDRNPTACTFEWDEANEEAGELERSSSRRKRRASAQPMGASHSHSQPVRARRPKRKWSEREIEVLTKAVKAIGESNWKQILDEYGQDFDNRTQVDLKDKWRNLLKRKGGGGGSA